MAIAGPPTALPGEDYVLSGPWHSCSRCAASPHLRIGCGYWLWITLWTTGRREQSVVDILGAGAYRPALRRAFGRPAGDLLFHVKPTRRVSRETRRETVRTRYLP